MSAQRWMLSVLLVLALLAPGAMPAVAEPNQQESVPTTETLQGAPGAASYPLPNWTYHPADGTAVGAGDLNGDGFDDVLVVAAQKAPWTQAVARVFYGSANGLTAEPDWVLHSYWQTCPAGDVNGDGYDDLFAASLDGMRVFYGSPTGLTPGEPWRGASISLGAAGDVNGDGFADLLAGDPYFTDGQEWEGSVSLYFGSPTGPSAAPVWTVHGDAAGEQLGLKVLPAGDINGDGFADFVAASANRVRVYHGSPLGADLAASAYWYWPQARVAAAGDVNGDGYDDLAVGNPAYWGDGWGQVGLFLGSPNGLDLSGGTDWRFDGDFSGANMGWAVAGPGDINGDGYADLVFSSTPRYEALGRVFAFYGSPRGLAPEPHWTASSLEGGAGFGAYLSLAGDINGDGYDDLLAGDVSYQGCPGCGTVRAYHGSAGGLRDSRILAQLTSQPFTIDGDLSDWPTLPGFTLDRSSAAMLAGQPAAPDDAAASLRVAWDATNLYLAVHVSDDSVVSDSPSVWDDDLIELGFYAVWDDDPRGGDTHQYTISANGRVTDFGNTGAYVPIDAAVAAAPDGWTTELRIPTTHLYGFYNVLARGVSLSFNLGLRDDDDGGAWDSYLTWRGTSTVGGQDFGRLALVAAGGPLEAPAAQGWQARPATPAQEPDPPQGMPAEPGSTPVQQPAGRNPVPNWSQRGVSAASAGDVNGDGFDDVLVHVSGHWVGTWSDLYLGGADGLNSARAAEVGSRTVGVGDLNGDGFADMAGTVGAAAGVWYGSPAVPGEVFDWGDPAGYAKAGDVNGDGYADLLIAEPTFSNGDMYEGRLLIFFGSAEGLDRTPGWIVEGEAHYFFLGVNAKAIGDVNGDGFDDLVSGPSTAWGVPNLVSVLYGSPAGPASPTTAIVLPHGNFNTAGAGDVNGDGFDDLLVGDPHHRSTSTYPFSCGAGRVLLHLGSAGGVAASPAWSFEGDRNGACLGYSVAGAGDVNGDGYADILAGAPSYDYGTAGYAFGFLGSPQGLATAPHWVSWRRGGAAAAGVGDVNGDSYDDVYQARGSSDWRYPGEVLVFHGSAAGLAETRLFSQRASAPPAIDGDLSEWPAAPAFTLDRSSAMTILGQTPGPADAAATVRAQWDLLNLYLAIHVADDAVVSDSASIWDDDLVELAFYAVWDGDPRGGDTHQYTVSADGRVTDFGKPITAAPIEAAVRTVPDGWNVEVRIPHTSMFGFYNLYREGVSLTFNLGLRDDDDGGAWDSYLILRGDSTTNGQGFGQLLLMPR